MDPLTAYSLFCNIVTTVEGAVKLVRGLKELYESKAAFSRDHERVLENVGNLEVLIDTLSTQHAQISGVRSQPLLDKVASECQEVIENIRALLDRCAVKADGSRVSAVLKSWMASQATKSELQHLQSSLESRSSRLQMAIMCAIQYVYTIPS
jgi:ElaB/YqjD/DUF883 family membrane-anchored ribosome-binding protein